MLERLPENSIFDFSLYKYNRKEKNWKIHQNLTMQRVFAYNERSILAYNIHIEIQQKGAFVGGTHQSSGLGGGRRQKNEEQYAQGAT